MTIKERLIAFIKSLNIGQGAFEREVGLSNGYVNNIRVSIQPDKLQRIALKYPTLNTGWLMTGEGEMLKGGGSITTTEQTTYVPLLPISAQAGTLDYFTQSVSAQECEQIISPIRSVDFAVPVTGDSMQPEYPSGSKILVKRINADAFIEWGRCYVLDTLNGIVIKKIMPATDHEKVKCVSINPDYPPFDVDKSDIRTMYRVLMLLSEK